MLRNNNGNVIDHNLPLKSLIATTRVRVDPIGTIPLTGGAQGPFPLWISIQQSTLSPLKHL